MELPSTVRRRQKNRIAFKETMAMLCPAPVDLPSVITECKSHKTIQCLDCGLEVQPKGMHTHKRWCKKKGNK